jgi:hypothetical protein
MQYLIKKSQVQASGYYAELDILPSASKQNNHKRPACGSRGGIILYRNNPVTYRHL